MAIQNRRGYEEDFEPAKMLPGEWAVSLDTKYVRMCFAPGECLRMATYEGFEQDMEEVIRILAECQDIQTAIEQIQNNISDTELVIENYVVEAKKYRDEAKQYRDEAETFTPEGYADLVQNVADNTVKIDTVIEKAELNIKNTASGETIHVTDSADSKVIEFGLHGKAEQNGTPTPDAPVDIEVAGESYNLLKNSTSTQTIAGITFTVNSDKSVTANGVNALVSAGTVAFNIFGTEVKKFKAGVNYLFSIGNTALGTCAIALNKTNDGVLVTGGYKVVTSIGKGNNSALFSLTQEDIDTYPYLMVQLGVYYTVTNVDNETFYPMIRKASVKNDRYMPYGVGSIEVKSVGKNLWNHESMATNESGIERPGIIVESGTYTITNNSGNVVYCRDGNGTATSIQSKSTLTRTFNSEGIIWTSPSTSDVQVEEGSVATPYQPYTETTSLISTPEGLASVGGVYDEIIKYADGSGKRIQRLFKEVLNGSEDWSLNTVNSYGIANFNTKPQKAIATAQISSHFVYDGRSISVVDSPSFNITSANIFLRMKSGDISDVDSLKTWLASNNVTVLYELATPIITDLTAEEIAEIEKLHTFYPVTNISNDADCNMAVKYLADAKNYIDGRIALIESAIINNI